MSENKKSFYDLMFEPFDHKLPFLSKEELLKTREKAKQMIDERYSAMNSSTGGASMWVVIGELNLLNKIIGKIDDIIKAR